VRHRQTISQLAGAIKRWAELQADVTALLWAGSFARDQVGERSDLDVAVLVSPSADIPHQMNALATELQAFVCRESGEKWVLWTGERLLKTDITIASNPDSLAWLVDADDVEAPRLRLAFDRDGRAEQLLVRAARQPTVDVPARVITEVEKFVIAFEACSSAHANSDAYAFYFHYNLALGRLVRLCQLCRRGPSRLYLPLQFASSTLRPDERPQFADAAGTLKLPYAQDCKQRLFDLFASIRDDICANCRLPRPFAEYLNLCDAVLRRDCLFNVFDWSDSFPGVVRERTLIRSGTLTRWQDRPFLVQWLASNGIKAIYDLREDGEGSCYSETIRQTVEVKRFPLPRLTGLHLNNDPHALREDLGEIYAAFAEANADTIAAICRDIAHSAGPFVVHCHAGRDRTGIVLAMLATILGLPRSEIENDYTRPRQGTVRRSISECLNRLAPAGGIESLLMRGGLSPEDLASLRKRLLVAGAVP
jgi:predicted nucleotidyltransferase